MAAPQPSTRKGLIDRHPFFWLGLLGLLWGANFLFMKSATWIEPSFVVWLRLFSGALALAPFLPGAVALARREAMVWLHVLVMSLSANVLTFHCFMEGTARLGAGLAGVISGSIPLLTALLAAAFLPSERLGWRGVAGLVVSFAGLMVITAPWRGLDNATLSGAGFMLLGALGYAAAFVYARKFLSGPGTSALHLAALQMSLACLLYAPWTHWPDPGLLARNPAGLAEVALGLGVAGSGLAYVVYYGLVRSVGAVTASSVTYLPPVTALFLGWLVLGEAVGAERLAGAALVLGGVFLLRR